MRSKPQEKMYALYARKHTMTLLNVRRVAIMGV